MDGPATKTSPVLERWIRHFGWHSEDDVGLDAGSDANSKSSSVIEIDDKPGSANGRSSQECERESRTSRPERNDKTVSGKSHSVHEFERGSAES